MARSHAIQPTVKPFGWIDSCRSDRRKSKLSTSSFRLDSNARDRQTCEHDDRNCCRISRITAFKWRRNEDHYRIVESGKWIRTRESDVIESHHDSSHSLRIARQLLAHMLGHMNGKIDSLVTIITLQMQISNIYSLTGKYYFNFIALSAVNIYTINNTEFGQYSHD